MIAYTPRRCVSSISGDNSDSQTQQETYPTSLYRVPSDDDPRAFRRTTTMVLPQTSPHAGGGLPMYSPSSSAASSHGRSSRRLSSFMSSSASSLGLASPRNSCYYGRMYGNNNHNDDDESIYAKSTKLSSSSSSSQFSRRHHRRHQPESNLSLRTNFLIATLLLTALFHAYAAHRTSAIATNLSILRLDLRTLLFDHNTDKMALSEARATEKEWQGDIDYAQKEIARRSMTRSLLKRDGKGGQNEVLLQKEEALRDRLGRLEKDIADISRMEAIERFGEGPHRVEFTLQFMNEHGTFVPEVAKSRTNKFVVELAPVSLMPHSVLHFLETIDHELWDGNAFVHHVDHVVQAVPTAFRTAESRKETFVEAGLTELAFQEYHEDYPHDAYTVGFSGRPGGMEFYINTQDNAQIHGPGGQQHHDLHEEGDPCFGKVISGHHVIDRMQQKNVEAKKVINIIGIEKAILLPKGSTSHLNPYSPMARYQKNAKLSQHQKTVTDAYCRVLNREANISGLVANSMKLSDGATVKEVVANLVHSEEFEEELLAEEKLEDAVWILFDSLLAREPKSWETRKWKSVIEADGYRDAIDKIMASKEYERKFGADLVPGRGRPGCPGNENEEQDAPAL